MKDKKSKGFTLIELIAVLVILAVIALIVTPLVLNIVKKAKDATNKRSVDAYGKAIDLAITTYLLDTGDFPTSIEELTIEYSGSEVVCGIKKLNEDASIYLSECTVGGVEVKDSSTDDGYYHYGKMATYKEYAIGDIIEYQGMNFYVIENSDETNDSITLLKAEPLTVDEINTYGVGHVNNYTYLSRETANKYSDGITGGMAYYSSSTCGYPTAETSTGYTADGCTTEYAQSEIKYVVDNWSAATLKTADLKEDSLGYKARLLTVNELTNNMGYEIINNGSAIYGQNGDTTPEWVYDSNYWYWTMSPSDDSSVRVWGVSSSGSLLYSYVNLDSNGAVRPVITIYKSVV